MKWYVLTTKGSFLSAMSQFSHYTQTLRNKLFRAVALNCSGHGNHIFQWSLSGDPIFLEFDLIPKKYR